MEPDNGIPQVELYVKASFLDNGHRSSCPFCQRWFMVLFLKSEVKELALTVIPVNMSNPQKEFKEFHSQPPVVVHNGIALTDNEKIEMYIDQTFLQLDLRSDKGAEDVCSDLYMKFNQYLQAAGINNDPKKKALLGELKRINDYYGKQGGRYMSGDELTHIDCEVLPKLQHVRVAGKAYKDFEIPSDLTHLWRYLASGYKTRAFQESCPSDQDIILHYQKKVQGQSLVKNPTLQKPTYSWDLPSDVDITANGNYHEHEYDHDHSPRGSASGSQGSSSSDRARNDVSYVSFYSTFNGSVHE